MHVCMHEHKAYARLCYSPRAHIQTVKYIGQFDVNLFTVNSCISGCTVRVSCFSHAAGRPITIGGADTRLLKYSVLPKLSKEKFEERGAQLSGQ